MEAQPEELKQEDIKKPEAGERVRLDVSGRWVESLVLSSDDDQIVVLPLSVLGEDVRVGQRVAFAAQSGEVMSSLSCSVKHKAVVPLLTLADFGDAVGVERRRSSRMPALIKVEIWRSDEEEDSAERRVAVSAELSLAGIALRLAGGQDLREGTPVQLTLHPAEGVKLTLSGIVRRHQVHTAGQFKSYNLGVEWVDMTEQDRNELVEIIMRRHPHTKRSDLL